MLTLRLRLAAGGTHTLQISRTASLAELFQAAATASGHPLDGLKLSSGFPPKALEVDEAIHVGSKLQNMETLTVAGTPAGDTATGNKKAKKAPATSAPSNAGVVTLSDVSGGSSSKKRAPAARGGGGGGSKKQRALQLGSEEGIGESLACSMPDVAEAPGAPCHI